MKFIDESILPEPPIGAHLVSPRRAFKHHGIYIGKGKVIHYSGMARSIGLRELKSVPSLIRYGSVVKTSLKYFCDGHGFEIIEHPQARFSGEAAVERAKKRLCERSYYIYSNNCEHFVHWCIEDEFKSPFVTRLLLFSTSILMLIQWGVSGKAFRSENSWNRLVFGTISSILGSFASVFITSQALQPANGMRGRERNNRRLGRKAMNLGALLGMILGIIATKKLSRLLFSVSPYILPTVSGLSAYGISRFLDTKRKEKIRQQRTLSTLGDS